MSDNEDYGAELDDIVQQTEKKITNKEQSTSEPEQPKKLSFLQNAAKVHQQQTESKPASQQPASLSPNPAMPPDFANFEKMMAGLLGEGGDAKDEDFSQFAKMLSQMGTTGEKANVPDVNDN